MIKIIKESKDEVINEDDDKSKPINIIYDIEVPVNISAKPRKMPMLTAKNMVLAAILMVRTRDISDKRLCRIIFVWLLTKKMVLMS